MDISATLEPKSDQLDATDLSTSGPRTFTVAGVSKGSAEQPVNVRLEEFPRVWRPGKSMRRVLGKLWGTDASKWTGKRLTLFCDDTVQFGGEAVGGIRISHMSDIRGEQKVPLIVTRGRSAMWTVQPLKDAPPTPTAPTITPEEIAASTDRDQLRAWWNAANPTQRKQIEARVAELDAEAESSEPPTDAWASDEQQPLDVDGGAS